MGYDMYIANPDPVATARKSELWNIIYGRTDEGLIQRLNQLIANGEASPEKPSDDPFEFYPFWRKYTDTGGTDEFHETLADLAAAFDEYELVESQVYYRLNIWGMGRCRGFMWERGMVHEEGNEPRTWPVPEAYGLEHWPDDEQYDDEGNPIGPWPEDSPEARFNRDKDAVLAYSPGVPGIPLWKLGSNDGWLVTEEDCRGALQKLREWAKDVLVALDLDPTDDDAVEQVMLAKPTDRGDDGKTYEIEWWPSWVEFLRNASVNGGFRTH